MALQDDLITWFEKSSSLVGSILHHTQKAIRGIESKGDDHETIPTWSKLISPAAFEQN